MTGSSVTDSRLCLFANSALPFKTSAVQVFAVAGRDPLIDIALALLEGARADDYFVSRSSTPMSTSSPAWCTEPWASHLRSSLCSLLCRASPATCHTGGRA